MTVVYSKKADDCEYQVRTAGNSVRLYSNGVLHSQYNPLHPISGAIWDLLLLPAFLRSVAPTNILLLGLGGGTLVHLIRLFFPAAKITCVDRDGEHINIAKKYFKIPTSNVHVVQGDAYEFLESTQDKFDWIIDDVFQHITGEPERGSSAYQWLNTYQSNLTPDGILSLNIIGKRQFENIQTLMAGFNCVVQFMHPLYENKIVAFLQTEPQKQSIKKGFKARITGFKALDQSRKTCRLNYKMRMVKGT